MEEGDADEGATLYDGHHSQAISSKIALSLKVRVEVESALALILNDGVGPRDDEQIKGVTVHTPI